MSDPDFPTSAGYRVEALRREEVAARCVSACYESVLSAEPPSEALNALSVLAGASRWILHDAPARDVAPERILPALAQHMGLVIGPPTSWNWLPSRDRDLVLPPALMDIATRLGNAAWLIAVFQVSDDRTRIIGLSVDSGTPPQQGLRDCLNRVLHHVQRASRLAHAVEARTARQSAAIGMLAHVDHSMAAIDLNRKIEFANPAFEQLLNDQTIFSSAGGRLVMIDPKEDRRLGTALSEIIAMYEAATGAPLVAQRTLVSHKRVGHAPLMVRVAPHRQPRPLQQVCAKRSRSPLPNNVSSRS